MSSPATDRLRTLESTGLLDSPPEPSFDRLTRLAAGLLDAPVALVSLVDDRRQFFKSALGLLEPWASRRETPISHSFCQYVTRERTPLVVSDAREHPLLRDNLAIRDLSAIAYAGIPLMIDDQAIGAFCVIDARPRQWRPDQVELLQDLAASVVTEIELRMALDDRRQQIAELKRSEQIHRAIVQHLPSGAVFVLDRDLRYVSAEGPLMTEIQRRAGLEGGLIGRYAGDLVSPANREVVLDRYRRALAGERTDTEVERDGRYYDMSVVPIHDGEAVTHALISSYDVTDRRRQILEASEARDSLARERTLFETTLVHIEDGVALIDGDSRILLANHAFAAMLGLTPAEVIGLTREGFVRQVGPLLEDAEGFAEALAAQPEDVGREFTFARPRRRILTRTWTRVPLSDGDGILVTWHDVTAERDLLREREQQLLLDVLTGIPNRRAAETALRTERQRMKRAGTPMSVALFDIDHFKQVNDVHGHGAGDQVLRAVAGTLAGQARLTDTVARWGGEEFLAVLNVPLEGARTFCERARAAVETLRCPPVERVTVSAGVAEVAAGETVSDAIARADKHLYDAKRAGRNRIGA